MKIPLATILLVFVMTVAFIYVAFFIPDVGEFYDVYGFSGENMLIRPEVLITSIFLHGGLTHLLSNVLILLFFGSAVEAELGKKRMLAIFFAGAFLGDIFSLFVYPFDAVAVGASAGIFALIGTGIFVRPVDLSFYPLVIPIPLALLGIMYAVFNAYGIVAGPTSISYVAHFGGLVVGVLYGVRREGWKRSMFIVVLSLAVLIALPLIWNAITAAK